MKTLTTTVLCCLFVILMTSISKGEEIQSAKIGWNEVPAKVMQTANAIETGIEWRSAYRILEKPSGSEPIFQLTGNKVLRAERERITSDGDIDIIPGDSRLVNFWLRANGTLIEFAIGVPLDEVPRPVIDALKREIQLDPSEAFEVRKNAQGKPEVYIFWIDSKGLFQYSVTPDGKKVQNLTTL